MAEEAPLPTQLLAVLNAGGQQALARTIGDLARNWLAEHGWADHLSELDCTTYQDHYSLPPRGWPVAAIIRNSDNQLEDMVFVENEGGLWEWLDSLGLHFETDSAGVHELSVPDDIPLSLELHNQLATLQAFEWHAYLVEPDYTTIYRAVFEHFGRHAEHFSDLHWRGFEQLCASMFTAQGYTTELGKGRNDDGVDIRLTAHPVYGQQLTVVQAKRQKKKIELNLVQAILGAALGERADRSIFVTSSRFLPGVERWTRAHPTAIPLELADRQKLAEWCRELLPEAAWLRQQAASWSLGNAKIVVASRGVRMINSTWAAVVAETRLAGRLIPLDALYERMPTDPLRGTETPDLAGAVLEAGRSFTARRVGDRYAGDDGQFYHVWDRKPRYVDDAD
jgi:hypothetical protein